jgi:hypothetical protein
MNNTLPMGVSGIHNLIQRAYNESGPFQWVRETYINAVEAGATKVEYGTEWQ